MTEPTAPPPVVLTVVRAPACHFCADAEAALSELSATFDLTVQTVELEAPDGARLVALHRPAMSPLVLLDGEYFSSGRLPRTKLRRILEKRATAGDARGRQSAEARHGH